MLIGWRQSTVDADLKLDPEPPGAFEAIARIKNELDVNIELSAPDQFLPELPGWRERSPFIERSGEVDFHHYDFYAQALAKIERGHARDHLDVQQMIERNIVDPRRLEALYGAVENELVRFPAIESAALREKLNRIIEAYGEPRD